MTLNDLPADATTFDAMDFGAYTPRGYSASRVSGVMTGVPIKYLFEGVWLTAPGSSGTSIIIRNDKHKELGRIYVNSLGDTPVFRPA
jgi:hypothetical protein